MIWCELYVFPYIMLFSLFSNSFSRLLYQCRCRLPSPWFGFSCQLENGEQKYFIFLTFSLSFKFHFCWYSPFGFIWDANHGIIILPLLRVSDSIIFWPLRSDIKGVLKSSKRPFLPKNLIFNQFDFVKSVGLRLFQYSLV